MFTNRQLAYFTYGHCAAVDSCGHAGHLLHLMSVSFLYLTFLRSLAGSASISLLLLRPSALKSKSTLSFSYLHLVLRLGSFVS